MEDTSCVRLSLRIFSSRQTFAWPVVLDADGPLLDRPRTLVYDAEPVNTRTSRLVDCFRWHQAGRRATKDGSGGVSLIYGVDAGGSCADQLARWGNTERLTGAKAVPKRGFLCYCLGSVVSHTMRDPLSRRPSAYESAPARRCWPMGMHWFPQTAPTVAIVSNLSSLARLGCHYYDWWRIRCFF